MVTVRDLLAWVEFICHTTNDAEHEIMSESCATHSACNLDLSASYVHGACIVFVDALVASGHLCGSLCCVVVVFLYLAPKRVTVIAFSSVCFASFVRSWHIQICVVWVYSKTLVLVYEILLFT